MIEFGSPQLIIWFASHACNPSPSPVPSFAFPPVSRSFGHLHSFIIPGEQFPTKTQNQKSHFWERTAPPKLQNKNPKTHDRWGNKKKKTHLFSWTKGRRLWWGYWGYALWPWQPGRFPTRCWIAENCSPACPYLCLLRLQLNREHPQFGADPAIRA